MIRHIPQSFRARVQQSRTTKDIYSLVSEAQPSEFQDALTVALVYSQFGKFYKHAPLAEDKTNLVLGKLSELSKPFPTTSSLVQSAFALSQLKSPEFKIALPKAWLEQISAANLSNAVFPDLVKLARSLAVLKRGEADFLRACNELGSDSRAKELASAPLAHLTSLLWSMANAPGNARQQVVGLGSEMMKHIARRQSELKPELVPELLCSASKLGLKSTGLDYALLAREHLETNAVRSTAHIANWTLGLSRFVDDVSKGEYGCAQAVSKRKLNEFVLVDLFKLALAFGRASSSPKGEFEKRFHQLLRNRKFNEDKVFVGDLDFGFPQALELIQQQGKGTPFQLYDDLALIFRANLRYASPNELGQCFEALRVRSYRNAELFDALLQELSSHRKIKSFAPHELVNILHSVAWFDYQKSGELVDAVAQHLREQQEDRLSAVDELRTAWSLASLDHPLAAKFKPDARALANATGENALLLAQLSFGVQTPPPSLRVESAMFKQILPLVQARYASVQTNILLPKCGLLTVDMFIPELNLAINVDDETRVDSKQETRLGVARFQRKQLKLAGHRVLNINHFMLVEENLDKFFTSLIKA